MKKIKIIAWLVLGAAILNLILSLAYPVYRERPLGIMLTSLICDTVTSVFGITAALVLVSAKITDNERKS